MIFSSILSISVYADEAKQTEKFWLIDKAETAPIIFIATKGEIQKDDFLTFLLDSDNCDEVGLSFQITSEMESVPTKDDIFQVLVKHNPGFEYITKAGIVGTYDLGDSFYSQFIFANILSVQEVIEVFSQKESFEIELLGKEDINNRNDLIEYINKIFGEKLSSHIDNNFYNILNDNKEQKVWEINLPNEFSRIYQNKDSDKSLFSQYYWLPKQQLYSSRFKNYEVELYN